VYIGFSIFLLGWIMQTVVIFGVPYTPSFYWSLNSIVTIIFSAFPWCTLAKGVQDLSSAAVTTSSPGWMGLLVHNNGAPHPSLIILITAPLSFYINGTPGGLPLSVLSDQIFTCS